MQAEGRPRRLDGSHSDLWGPAGLTAYTGGALANAHELSPSFELLSENKRPLCHPSLAHSLARSSRCIPCLLRARFSPELTHILTYAAVLADRERGPALDSGEGRNGGGGVSRNGGFCELTVGQVAKSCAWSPPPLPTLQQRLTTLQGHTCVHCVSAYGLALRTYSA